MIQEKLRKSSGVAEINAQKRSEFKGKGNFKLGSTAQSSKDSAQQFKRVSQAATTNLASKFKLSSATL